MATDLEPVATDLEPVAADLEPVAADMEHVVNDQKKRLTMCSSTPEIQQHALQAQQTSPLACLAPSDMMQPSEEGEWQKLILTCSAP